MGRVGRREQVVGNICADIVLVRVSPITLRLDLANGFDCLWVVDLEPGVGIADGCVAVPVPGGSLAGG